MRQWQCTVQAAGMRAPLFDLWLFLRAQLGVISENRPPRGAPVAGAGRTRYRGLYQIPSLINTWRWLRLYSGIQSTCLLSF